MILPPTRHEGEAVDTDDIPSRDDHESVGTLEHPEGSVVTVGAPSSFFQGRGGNVDDAVAGAQTQCADDRFDARTTDFAPAVRGHEAGDDAQPLGAKDAGGADVLGCEGSTRGCTRQDRQARGLDGYPEEVRNRRVGGVGIDEEGRCAVRKNRREAARNGRASGCSTGAPHGDDRPRRRGRRRRRRLLVGYSGMNTDVARGRDERIDDLFGTSRGRNGGNTEGRKPRPFCVRC